MRRMNASRDRLVSLKKNSTCSFSDLGAARAIFTPRIWLPRRRPSTAARSAASAASTGASSPLAALDGAPAPDAAAPPWPRPCRRPPPPRPEILMSPNRPVTRVGGFNRGWADAGARPAAAAAAKAAGVSS